MANVSKLKIGDTSYDICDATAREDISNILDIVNPIGKIIHCTDCDTEAKVIAKYGGNSWTRVTDKFILASGSDFSAGTSGGNKDAIIPYHNHTFTGTPETHTHQMLMNSSRTITEGASFTANPFGTDASGFNVGGTTLTPSGTVGYAGTSGNVTNANMPPYECHYIWKRIS